MKTVAVAIVCKAPKPGKSKTRLCPPLRLEECAEISSCFIQDLSNTIGSLTGDGSVKGYALYTPAGSERELRQLLPANFGFVLQRDGNLGDRLNHGFVDLLALGHAGAILVNSDSPTLPRSILRAAVAAVLSGDNLVISPAIDGGYTLIGLSKPHPHLFAQIPWSTDTVYQRTLDHAREIGLPVITLNGWYDVDDAASYSILAAELDGIRPAFADAETPAQDAPNTRLFLSRRCQASLSHDGD